VEVGERGLDVLAGTIETKEARTTRDAPKNDQGLECGGHLLTIVSVPPTHAKVYVKQQRLRALLHDANPVNIEVWRDRRPERWTGMSNGPP